jgi:hypothetical protein
MGMQTGTKYVGLNYFGANDTGWNLMGTEGNRTFDKDISFPTEFGEVPVARVYLTSFYLLGGEALINVHVKTVAATGITVRVQVWGDTQLAGCGIGWIAYDSAIWH